MRLDRVTITGPDDSIDPKAIRELSREFPFVEWGILVSANHFDTGGPRFPSHAWINRLKEEVRDIERFPCEDRMKLSLHVCGRWVRELLLGNVCVPPALIEGPTFMRVQLNFHAQREQCDPDKFYSALLALGQRQYIFQIDGGNGNRHLDGVYMRNEVLSVDAVPLFDISGGAGILPDEWPKPQYMEAGDGFAYHGYAGGLGPDNLEQQLPLIAAAAGDARIWIDMETRVRSDDDQQFDLAKVRRCLEICAPLIDRAVTV